MQALESLNKKDMTEIKSYGRPPPLVEKVMAAVMTLQCKEPTWAEAKRQLGEAAQRGVDTACVKLLKVQEINKYSPVPQNGTWTQNTTSSASTIRRPGGDVKV